ncbi:hypothetical protein HID58_028233, partial [Brassica napus]
PPKLTVFPFPPYNACDGIKVILQTNRSLLSVLRLYIYISQPNNPLLSKRIPALRQIKQQSPPCKPFSTFVSPRPEDSKLMFRLINFWETSINSKRGILIGTKYVIVDFFNHHHPQIDRLRKYKRLRLNSSLTSSWIRRLGVVMGLNVFSFVLSSTYIFNFGLFVLKRITNLKPGEEQEDPERRYV